MINLRKTLNLARTLLAQEKIEYALIGGFCLAAYGIHRATKDIDLLIDGTKKLLVKKIFLDAGFTVFNETDEVLQLKGPGYLDFVFANRPLSLEMIKNSKMDLSLNVPIISAEGIIGLKIQAYINDQSRRLQDLADIQELLKIPHLNMEQIKTYSDLFNEWPTINQILIDNNKFKN
jgi:hypothetical protein